MKPDLQREIYPPARRLAAGTCLAIDDRNEQSKAQSLMLSTPLANVALGVTIPRDPFDARMGAGAALALPGVLVVARPAGANPFRLLGRRVARSRV